MNPNLVLERQEVVLLKHSWVPYMAWLHICMTATLTLHFLLFLVSSFWRKSNFGSTNKIFKLMYHTAAKLHFWSKRSIQYSCLLNISCLFTYSILNFSCSTLFENNLKCCRLIFEFWHFFTNFCPVKLTCLVTLFDCKLQVFKNSPKWTILAFFKLTFVAQM